MVGMAEALDRAAGAISRAMAGERPRPQVVSFFDKATASVSHVLHDPSSRAAVVVDPVLDFEPASARTSRRSADEVLAHVRMEGLNVKWILETHVHADHLSAATLLRAELGAPIAMSRAVLDVRERFANVFNRGAEPTGGEPFDRLLDDGDEILVGHLECVALHVPGHTPADMAYVVGDAVLTGDTLFMPDFGTARADFPGGDATQLYRSVRRLLQLPFETRLLHCHDYPPPSRGPRWTSSVSEQRSSNVHVRDGVGEAEFVAMRTARDATLATPALMLASIQVNVDAGRLPEPASNGKRYLKIPLNGL